MAWVVDTCVLLDVGLDDPTFALRHQGLLTRNAGDFQKLLPALKIVEP